MDVCFDFCFQDDSREDSGNSASSHCASCEFTDRLLREDAQSGAGSAASGSGLALSSSLGSRSCETSGGGTGKEVKIWTFATPVLGGLLTCW